MFNHQAKIYQQALIVLDSSVGAPGLPLSQTSHDNFETDYSGVTLYQPALTEPVGAWVEIDCQITRDAFSSVPVLWASDLGQSYQELGEALSEITELGQEDDWRIEFPLFTIPRDNIASELMRMSFSRPKSF